MGNWWAAQERRRIRAVPNGPGGHSWVGNVPVLKWDPMPAPGSSVVYVLYDVAGSPIYVGSTEYMEVRLRNHLHTGKAFAAWLAYPCGDRASAYAIEARLIATSTPPLNKPRGVTKPKEN